MAKIDRRDYAATVRPQAMPFGGDTALTAVVEGIMPCTATNACMAAARRCGRHRHGRHHQRGRSAGFLLCNVMVIDPVVGIVKGDLGIRHGRIVRIGRPAIPPSWTASIRA